MYSFSIPSGCNKENIVLTLLFYFSTEKKYPGKFLTLQLIVLETIKIQQSHSTGFEFHRGGGWLLKSILSPQSSNTPLTKKPFCILLRLSSLTIFPLPLLPIFPIGEAFKSIMVLRTASLISVYIFLNFQTLHPSTFLFLLKY